MSHGATLQEKTLHRSVLIGFGSCHEFRNKLMTSVEVPLQLLFKHSVNICSLHGDVGRQRSPEWYMPHNFYHCDFFQKQKLPLY